ncbi:MAG: APC family permease [Clostridia bacterium]
MKKQEYNLFTAISMIIGIVIGSGIFFKADDILRFTGGSVWLGVFVFTIAAISIVFGSLSIAQLAFLTDKPGGIITYMEETWSNAFAGSFGFFHTLVYYPTLVVIISWVSGIYLLMLFGVNNTLELQCAIGVVIVIFLYLLNIYSKKLGNYLQISATIIKIIPLILIAFAGLCFGDTSNITLEPTVANVSKFGFISAIVPISFSFDGWIVATSIAHEVKNSKKALPTALVISPIFILVIYSLYLIGISAIIGPDQIIALGDDHVAQASTIIFGDLGAKLILVFVIISVIGAVNGLIIGLIRLPYSLAERGFFPKFPKINEVDETLDIPVYSAIASFLISMCWYVAHYFVMKFDLLTGSDVSEIAIVVTYVFYIALYVAVLKLHKKGVIVGIFKGCVFPILATIGSLIIFAGSIINTSGTGGFFNIKALNFIIVSAVIILLSYAHCVKIEASKKANLENTDN